MVYVNKGQYSKDTSDNLLQVVIMGIDYVMLIQVGNRI